MKEFSIMSLGAGVLLLMGCGEQRATQAADEPATAREVVNQAGDVLDQETDKPRAVVLVGDGEESRVRRGSAGYLRSLKF